jgi:hypothetical protein
MRPAAWAASPHDDRLAFATAQLEIGIGVVVVLISGRRVMVRSVRVHPGRPLAGRGLSILATVWGLLGESRRREDGAESDDGKKLFHEILLLTATQIDQYSYARLCADPAWLLTLISEVGRPAHRTGSSCARNPEHHRCVKKGPSQVVSASSAARIVGDHSMSRPAASRAIDLRTIDRHPLASVGTIVLGFRCSWCPGSAPMPKLLGLHALPPARRAEAAAV